MAQTFAINRGNANAGVTAHDLSGQDLSQGFKRTSADILDAEQAVKQSEDWNNLADRVRETNPFFRPDFREFLLPFCFFHPVLSVSSETQKRTLRRQSQSSEGPKHPTSDYLLPTKSEPQNLAGRDTPKVFCSCAANR